jgi:hypothetical protein
MAALSPADLVQRLSWRFQLLRGGPRTATDRHRTLRAVVDWSYNLLDEPSQRVFEVLSAFAGRFPLSAAEQLVAALPDVASAVVASGPDRDVAGAVLSLVDRSMVAAAPEAPTTYALLDTLRAYGRERIEARGCLDRVRRAHAELYTRLAVEAEGHLYRPGHVAAVERLAAAVDELRAAAAWAVEHDVALAARLVGAMAIYVEHRVPAEVPRWAEGTLAAAAQAERAVPGLAKVYGVAAAGARFAGDLDRGRALAEAGLAVVQDPATEGYLRYLLTEISLFQGRIEEAGGLIAQVTALRPTVPVAGMAALIGPLLCIHRGDVAAAVDRARAQVRRAERDGEEVTSAWATYMYGETLIDVDPTHATDLLLEALAAGRRTGDRYLTGVALTSAASVRTRHGDPRDAVPLFRDVLEHWRQLGDWTHQWTAMRNVVDLLVRTGRYREAAALHGALAARAGAVPTFGADAARMEQALGVLETRLGRDKVADLRLSGGRLGDDEVVARAMSFLTGPGTADG